MTLPCNSVRAVERAARSAFLTLVLHPEARSVLLAGRGRSRCVDLATGVLAAVDPDGGRVPDAEAQQAVAAIPAAVYPAAATLAACAGALIPHSGWRPGDIGPWAFRRRGARGDHETLADPACPPAVIGRAAIRCSPSTQDHAVSQPACPPASVAGAAASDDTSQRSAAVRNPNCPPAAVAALSSDDDLDFEVLCHPNCSDAALSNIAARRGDTLIRHGIINHRRCSPTTLALLADQPDPELRQAVAAHPKCSPTTLVSLAADGHGDVRAAVAAHARCPTATLRRLASEGLDDSRGGELAATPPPHQQPAAARPLGGVNEHDHATVRAAAAANVRCPPDSLTQLSRDPHPRVRSCAAASARSPQDALRHLAADPDNHTRTVAANNPHCPDDALAAIAAAAKGAPRGAPSRDAAYWAAAARNTSASGDTVAVFAASSLWLVRVEAAAHPHCPPHVRRRLADDPNSAVASAARRQISD